MTRSPIQLDEGFSEETHSQPGSDTMEYANGLYPAQGQAHCEHALDIATTLASYQKIGVYCAWPWYKECS